MTSNSARNTVSSPLLKSLLIFPTAALLNSFSMTALLLVFGLAGVSNVAADIGLVQSATLALFYAFSANARNLILGDTSGSTAPRLLWARILLIAPLSLVAYFLSVELAAVPAALAVILIIRRICEWIGEIGLAEHERNGQTKFAMHSSMLECLMFLLAVLLPLFFHWNLAASAAPWALVPLVAVRGTKLALLGSLNLANFRSFIPHLGSTAIIGTSTYVLRISIALLVGKAVAGDLFTAFALGGLIPTIYGQALAPTLARQSGKSGLSWQLLSISAGMLLASLSLTIWVLSQPRCLAEWGRTPAFWLATSASIGGGAFMILALALRTQLIQKSKNNHIILGPDMMANILISISVPFIYFIMGPNSFAWLYVLSSLLNLGFIIGVGRTDKVSRGSITTALWGIAFLLIMPLFFQIDGGLFRDSAFVFDSEKRLLRLPIPISVLGLFGGIALLGNYVSALRALTTIFFTALFFIASSLLSGRGNHDFEGAKLILLAQFLLPMFGLVLGQMYGGTLGVPIFEKAAFFTLMLLIPGQLVAAWIEKHTVLIPQFFFFSIYQHLQYVPGIVVALTFIVVSAFSGVTRKGNLALYLLVVFLGIYMIASHSFLAIASLVIGLIILRFFQHNPTSNWIKPFFAFSVMLLAMFAYGAIEKIGWENRGTHKGPTMSPIQNQILTEKYKYRTEHSKDSAIPVSLSARLEEWCYHTRGATKSMWVFVFGQDSPPDRKIHASAHNYWLDMLYNFGALSLTPLLVLLLWTLRVLWKWRSIVIESPLLLGLAMATVYLVLIENMFKVGMRQPYPGIITFFIWGLLIARIEGLAIKKSMASIRHESSDF